MTRPKRLVVLDYLVAIGLKLSKIPPRLCRAANPVLVRGTTGRLRSHDEPLLSGGGAVRGEAELAEDFRGSTAS